MSASSPWTSRRLILAAPLAAGGAAWLLALGAIALTRPGLDSPLWYVLFVTPLLVGAGAGQAVLWRAEPFASGIGRLGGFVLALGALCAALGLIRLLGSDLVFALIAVSAFLIGSVLAGFGLPQTGPTRRVGLVLSAAAMAQSITAPFVFFGPEPQGPALIVKAVLALTTATAVGLGWIWLALVGLGSASLDFPAIGE